MSFMVIHLIDVPVYGTKYQPSVAQQQHLLVKSCLVRTKITTKKTCLVPNWSGNINISAQAMKQSVDQFEFDLFYVLCI